MSNTIMALCKLAADDGSSVDINVGEGTVTCRYDHGFCKYRLEVRSSSSDGGFPSSSDTSISHSTSVLPSSSTTSISSTGSISHTPTSSNTLSSGISTSSAVEGKETSLTPPIQSRLAHLHAHLALVSYCHASRSRPSSGAVAGANVAGVVCLIIAFAYLQSRQRRGRINASRDRADTRERTSSNVLRIKNGGVVANPSSYPVGETLTNRIHPRPEGVPPGYAP
ncbi:hypothetical protein C8J57DRAFT_1337399 [Mycena rebaudengoi]|nr:hypothetical protein C8J57DRAFT_1337399 [Mycena rebaudengoi]